MFKLSTEAELLQTFRPKDREDVELDPAMKWPLIVRDCHSWVHPAGGKTFVVFSPPGGVPTGIVFETNGGSAMVPSMCDFCHSTSTDGRIGMLTARRNAKKRVGLNACVDLSCKAKLEEQADLQGMSSVPMVAKLIDRVSRFAHEALDIDLTGATR